MGLPPFVQQIIGALVRIAVVWFAGFLAARSGITLDEDQIGKLVTWLTIPAAIAVWSIYQKFWGRVKLLTAAASPHVLTEREVEAIVKDPAVPNPSVNTHKDELP